MSFSSGSREPGRAEKPIPECKVEVLGSPENTLSWTEIYPALKKLFSMNDINSLKPQVEDPKNISVLMRDVKKGELIGFSGAEPYQGSKETAYVYSTEIDPSYQGKKLVGKIMDVMEDEMRKRGFKFMARHVADRRYADAIMRHYNDRVVYASKPHQVMGLGLQRFIKIRL